MNILMIINDPPYGSEKPFNALRLAKQLLTSSPNIQINIFLLADAVFNALPNQRPACDDLNIEQLLNAVISQKANIRACISCLQARGIEHSPLIEGVEIGTMVQLSQWVINADKILNF